VPAALVYHNLLQRANDLGPPTVLAALRIHRGGDGDFLPQFCGRRRRWIVVALAPRLGGLPPVSGRLELKLDCAAMLDELLGVYVRRTEGLLRLAARRLVQSIEISPSCLRRCAPSSAATPEAFRIMG